MNRPIFQALLAIPIALALTAAASAAAARCLRYEPSPSTLTGTLESRTVPGPPGYQSLARGDYAETIWVLTLDEPICVTGDPASRSNAKSHTDVREVQLNVGPDARGFASKHVRAIGTLSAAQTRHHRTPVVLTVKTLQGT